MRELAAFSMRGPRQAAIAATILTLIPMLFWLGAAILALVTLRQGLEKGLAVFVWAIIPALGWWFGLQDPSAAVVLLTTWFMAGVLRSTVSWHGTLMAGFALSAVAGALVPVIMPETVEMLTQVLSDLLLQMAEQSPEVGDTLAPEHFDQLKSLMVASFAASFYGMAIGALCLGRSWQSALYNPGGWREEFHSLRLNPLTMAAFLLSSWVGPIIGIDGVMLAICATVPILLCGFALVHGLIGKKKLGGQWLFGFYVLVVILFPTFLFVLYALAIVDSIVDIRRRVQPASE